MPTVNNENFMPQYLYMKTIINTEFFGLPGGLPTIHVFVTKIILNLFKHSIKQLNTQLLT